MKLARFSSLMFAAMMLAASANSFAQASPAAILVGKWRHIALVRMLDDQVQEPQNFNGENRVEFKADGTWILDNPNNSASGTYKWLDAKRLETVIKKSGVADQVGVRSVRQVRVEPNRLNLITVQTRKELDKILPPLKPGETRPQEVVVTNVFTRDVAPGALGKPAAAVAKASPARLPNILSPEEEVKLPGLRMSSSLNQNAWSQAPDADAKK